MEGRISVSTVVFIVVVVIAWVVGVIGFSQIIGAIQNMKERPGLLMPMLLWILILAGGFFLEHYLLPEQPLPLIIGYAASFITVLAQGKVM